MIETSLWIRIWFLRKTRIFFPCFNYQGWVGILSFTKITVAIGTLTTLKGVLIQIQISETQVTVVDRGWLTVRRFDLLLKEIDEKKEVYTYLEVVPDISVIYSQDSHIRTNHNNEILTPNRKILSHRCPGHDTIRK